MSVVVCLLVGAAFARGADSSLANARRAQAKLGPEIWSEVIRIENVSTAGGHPRAHHALVFELADILWFYTDADGTQSLSLRRNSVAEDKADLTPLLRAIEPRLRRWSVVDGTAATATTAGGELPNGCFIESVAALRARRERGDVAANAQLLSYYINTDEGRRGHTVLTYAVDRVVEVIDSEQPGQVLRFSAETAADALCLARSLAGERVAKARWLPLDQTSPSRGFFAGGGWVGDGDWGNASVW